LWTGAGVLSLVAVAAAGWVMGSRSTATVAAPLHAAASGPVVAALPPEAASASRTALEIRPAPASPAPVAPDAGSLPLPAKKSIVPPPARVSAPMVAGTFGSGAQMGTAPPPGIKDGTKLPRPELAAHADDARPAERAVAPAAPTPVADAVAVVAPPVHPPASAAPVVPSGPTSPREACVRKGFLAGAACMEEQCDTPRFKSHPQCVQVNEFVERRKHGEDGGGGTD
jgi:hypothetical protein